MSKKIITISAILIFFQFHAIASIVILNGLAHSKTASIGESYSGYIEIQNASAVAKTIRIYQTDYTFDYNGNAFYGEDLSAARTNAHWIEFSPKQTRINAGEIIQVKYQVNIPANDSLNGTFWSMMMVEEITPPDPNASSQLAITTTMRYAIQIATNIGNTGISSLRKIQHGLSLEENGQTLFLDIENDGEQMITPKFLLEVYDNSGTKVLSTEHPARKLYPGTSLHFGFLVQVLSSGKYSAICFADGGEEEIFGFEIDFEIP